MPVLAADAAQPAISGFAVNGWDHLVAQHSAP